MKQTTRGEPVYEVGDIVYLVSGSPKMTVVERSIGYVRCAWFAYEVQEARTAVFPPAALKPSGEDFR